MSRPTLRVAIAQISTGPEQDANLAMALKGIEEAAKAGAAMVVLPEATQVWFASDLRVEAQPLDGPFAAALREAAQKHKITVAAGLFEPAKAGKVRNTLLVTGPEGEHRYSKVHLFDAFGARESDMVEPGEGFVTAKIGNVTFGFAICYDLRFAEQFIALGQRGAEVIVASAAWGEGPGKAEQWDILTRARAMDAQAWLVAAGQAWQPPQGAAPLGVGRSCVVDPLGQVRAQLSARPDMLVHDIDLSVVADVRNRVPALAHKARSL